MKQLKQRKGITLVALVITIIVLLILAGITISLTIGEDGIIRRAQEAGRNYQEAAQNENTQLAEFTDKTDKIIAMVVDGIPVPKGFTHTEGTKETGFVIKDTTTNADGTPTATNGNEFVWVPCTLDGANGSIKYDRYAFKGKAWMLNQEKDLVTGRITDNNDQTIFTETMSSDEEASVKEHGGFYIGRYESGIEGYGANIKEENTDELEEWTGYSNGKLVIQKDKQIWNYITRNQAKIESEKLYQKSKGDSVNSKLCSSYGWDTALKFIETQKSTYPTNSEGGYYDQSSPTSTGYDKVHPCNIYDMGGNVWEWTVEDCVSWSYSQHGPFTCRGGGYSCNTDLHCAATRYAINKRESGNWIRVQSHFIFVAISAEESAEIQE